MEQRTLTCELLEIYKSLLTKTQYEVMYDFYALDLTQTEIAEQRKVTRQSIKDCINLCSERLLEFEKTIKAKKMRDLLVKNDIAIED